MRLSKRLAAVATMVSPDGVFCDVGCDHGYLSIALVQGGRISRAIATDLRSGPLAIAAANVAREGVSDRIALRLSDGLAAVQAGEVQSIAICGMGGLTVMTILSEGLAVARAAAELIVQPQSEQGRVRRFLREQHFAIVDEDMVREDGKFYTILKAIPVEAAAEDIIEATLKAPADAPVAQRQEAVPAEPEERLADAFGGVLLRNRHPVLADFLAEEEKRLCAIMATLPRDATARRDEVQGELVDVRRARRWMSG